MMSYFSENHNQVRRRKPRLFTSHGGVPSRVERGATCPVLEQCFSCPLIDLPYKNQLAQKKDDFKSLLNSEQGGRFAMVPVRDCVGSEERLGYRHTVQVVVSERFGSEDPASRRIELGFYKRDSGMVIDIGRCPVQASFLNDALAFLRTAIRTHRIPVYTPANPQGLLHGVILKASHAAKQMFVIFLVTQPDCAALLKPLARELGEKLANIKGIFFKLVSAHKKTGSGQTSDGQALHWLAGSSLLEDLTYDELALKVSPASHLFTNPLLVQKMHRRVLELADLSAKDTVLHVNCGMGLLALSFAKTSGASVIGLEESALLVEDALCNKEHLRVDNISFYQGNPEVTLQTLMQEKKLDKVDVVVLSSARFPTAPGVLQSLQALKPRVVLTLSSFPRVSLGDIEELSLRGFKPEFFELFDSLPGALTYEVLGYLRRV